MNNSITSNGVNCYINGLHISHPASAISALNTVVVQFDKIIEVGYYKGGLTQYFAEFSSDDCKVVAYDINDKYRSDENFTFNNKISFEEVDCFSNQGFEKIKNEINHPGKVLLFCDGGDKDREFNLFSPFLKSGDVIMVHDYHDDSLDERYASHVNWPYAPECYYSDIKNSVETFDLKKYSYDLFRTNLIGSFTK